jgi:O-acetyl-ADP-ribose deacetylase (regulator of RNase III)
MRVNDVSGDLLEQDVDVIVNSWNRNIIPWRLPLPQGVSGAIKRKGGQKPFHELAKFCPIPLGQARITSAGELRYKGIIHVAGINMLWMATAYSISESVRSAMTLAKKHSFKSIAFPLIGSGSGNRGRVFSKKTMMETFEQMDSTLDVTLVTYNG